MKQSGITTLFILVCIAVLVAAYGVGLGVKKIRFARAEAKVTASSETTRRADQSESDGRKVASDEGDPNEQSEEAQEDKEVAEEPNAESDEDVAAGPDRPEGEREMMGGMRERFQNMSDQERREAIARARERFGGRARRAGPLAQLSEEDTEKLRAEMEELAARAGEMTDDQRRQARNEILEKYGIDPEAGRRGRRRSGGGGGGGAPPVKGRACFVPQTPVWVDGKMLQIAKVTAGRTISVSSCGASSVAQLQEHEGTFECRDVVLESGETIGVVGAHCFMLESGKWIAAQNLTAGIRLKTLNDTVAIKKVTKRAIPYTGKVYNLKINNSDSYFVGKDVIIVRDY